MSFSQATSTSLVLDALLARAKLHARQQRMENIKNVTRHQSSDNAVDRRKKVDNVGLILYSLRRVFWL
jgi:hypothetical protein